MDFDIFLDFCILNFSLFATGEIKSGIPTFQIPPFSFSRPVEDVTNYNESYTDWANNATEPIYETVTFDVVLRDLGAGLVLVPVIGSYHRLTVVFLTTK